MLKSQDLIFIWLVGSFGLPSFFMFLYHINSKSNESDIHLLLQCWCTKQIWMEVRNWTGGCFPEASNLGSVAKRGSYCRLGMDNLSIFWVVPKKKSCSFQTKNSFPACPMGNDELVLGAS